MNIASAQRESEVAGSEHVRIPQTWSFRLLAILFVGAIVRLAIAWAPFEDFHLLKGPLVDDSFYLFTIARNVARGLGPMHDSVAITTGFQPLATLLMVPIYWLLPDSPILAIHVVLTLLAAASTLAGWHLGRIAYRFGGGQAAVAAALLWSASPYVIDQTMNGLETALAVWLQLLLVDRYFAYVRRGSGASNALAMAGFGALAALAYLARVDSALLLAVLAIDFLLARRRAALLPLAWAGAAAFLLSLPWHLFCYLTTGSPLPESGAAVALLSQIYSQAGFMTSHAAHEPAFVLDNLLLIARVVLTQPSTAPFLFPVGYAMSIAGASSAAIVCAHGGLFAAAFLLRARLRRSLPRAGLPHSLWLWAGLLVVAYAVWVPGQWFYERYLFPAVVVALLATAVLFGAGLRRFARPTAGAALLAVLVGAAMGHQFVERLASTDGMNIAPYKQTVDLVDALGEIPEPVGVFQSGVFGYFTHRSFVALDGKVNHAIYEGLSDGRVFATLAELEVGFIIDTFEWIPALMLAAGSKNEETLPPLRNLQLFQPRTRTLRKALLIGEAAQKQLRVPPGAGIHVVPSAE